MKKEYKKPIIECASFIYETQPLMHSDHHVGAKGFDLETEDSESDESSIDIKNLWDE